MYACMVKRYAYTIRLQLCGRVVVKRVKADFGVGIYHKRQPHEFGQLSWHCRGPRKHKWARTHGCVCEWVASHLF